MDFEQTSINVESPHLHKAIEDNNLELMEKLIWEGHNINEISTVTGLTPLIQALQNGNVEAVKRLLKNGADVAVESCEFGSPLNVALSKLWSHQLHDLNAVLEALFLPDGSSPLISLASFIIAIDTPIFSKVSEKLFQISIDLPVPIRNGYRRHGCVLHLIESKPNYCKLLVLESEIFQNFFYKFCDVIGFWCFGCEISDLFGDYSPIDSEKDLLNVVENLYFILEREFLTSQDLENLRDDHLWIYGIVNKFNDFNLPLSTLTNFILHLLSYGIITSVTSHDLIQIHQIYQHCELFNLLLFTNIEIMYGPINVLLLRSHPPNYKYCHPNRYLPVVISYAASDVRSLKSLEKIIGKFPDSPNLIYLLEYFADVNLKKRCKEIADDLGLLHFSDQIISYPNVPSLKEITRNSLRCLIIEKYKTDKSCQFYTVLNKFGAGKDIFKIMSFETKMYPLLQFRNTNRCLHDSPDDQY